MRKWLPAAAIGAAHLFVHFSLPLLDMMMHGGFFLALWLGSRSNA